MKKGFSVIEILVSIGVFAMLGIIATQSINLSLRSSKKSDSIVLVKQELDNAAGSIERLLQNANSVIVGGNYCTTNAATPSIGFRNPGGFRGDVACLDTASNFYILGNDTRIASSSSEATSETIGYTQRLTSNKIQISECYFKCYTTGSNTYIDFYVKANPRGIVGAEGSIVETSRKILIRGAIRK